MTTRAPLIGITTYAPNAAGDYCLEADYVAAVRRAGGVPILLPPGEPLLRELLDRLDGVILSGGGDVDPAHYGSPGHAAIYAVEPERDAAELALAQTLAGGDMPALCICRGMQVLNVALGGTLVEHLPDETSGAVVHRDEPPGATLHEISIAPDTHLVGLLGSQTVEAASWHHQAVRTLAPGLKVAATAPDGTVEAVELPGHPWLAAIQWHPEMTAGQDPVQQGIFDAFVETARNALSRRHEGTKNHEGL